LFSGLIWLIALWCKHRCLHRCKRRCDGKGRVLGSERRRRWSVEQKQAIVAAAFWRGTVVRDVARQADVTPSLIYRRRRGLRAAANGFAQVLVAPAGGGIAMPPVPAIEVQ
jgi:hypothetical protein